MKNKIIYIFLFAILFLFIVFIPNSNASVEIPQEVHDYAKSRNYGYDNYIILYDKNDGKFYVPYETSCYSADNYKNGTWKYRKYNDVYCFTSPSWWMLGLDKYSGNSWSSVSTNNTGSNSIIQLNPSFDNHDFEIVYSSKPIYYTGIPGHTNSDIYYSYLPQFSVSLSTTEYSSKPIQAYSNWFDMKFQGRFKCYISTDAQNWLSMHIRTLNDNNSTYYGFYYDIQYNGAYYFKCVDTVNNKTKTLTFNITNLKDKIDIEFYLSNTDNTTEPIYILSNKYYYTGDYDASDDFLNNYDIDIAYGYDMPYDFAPFAVDFYDEVEQKNYRQYRYKIVCNGIYNLRILDLDTGNISYVTFKVDNIGHKNKYGDDIYYDNYDENGNFRPTPVLFLEYLNTTTVRIRTQPFTFNELIYLECFVSSDGENFEKNNNIYNYTVDTSNSIYDYGSGEKKNNIDLYYFYFDVQLDGTYYFKFYNIESKEYTQSSIDVNIKQFINNNISNIDNFSDKMFLWARQHFGFLFYPFEFIVEFLNRVLNINYTEPILIIPELREPFFNNKILDETIFNFNSILSNSTVSFIYNIYLIVVDVILIFLFVNFCKNIFEEVFGK